MPPPTITTRIQRDGVDLPVAGPIAVDEVGVALRLAISPGRALVEAALTVQVPDDRDPIDLLATAIATTSVGVGDLADPSGWGPVEWVVLDWKACRGLVRLDVTLSAAGEGDAPAADGDGGGDTEKTATAGASSLLRLRISSDEGPWVLATPLALVPLRDADGVLGAGVQLPGLSASRIMIEVVNKPESDPLSPEDYVPVPVTLAGLKLTGSRRPPALSIGVPPTAIVHHEPGLLPPAAVRTVRESLLSALTAALPDTAGGTATIVVRSPGAAFLERLTLELGSRPEVTTWRGGRPALDLPLGPGRDATVVVDLDAAPTAFAARVEATLRPERPPVIADPVPTGYGHRCGPDSALAQGFCFGEAVDLVGVDLMLAARSRSVQGRVTFHADDHGRPAEPPLATLPLDLPAEDTRAAASWRALDLPAPVAFAPDALFWVVLTLAAGAADWALGPRADSTPVRGLLRRERGEAWVPRDMTFEEGPASPWAFARPRLRRVGPAPALDLRLRRGGRELALVEGAGGRVALDEAALAALRGGPDNTPLELLVRSNIAGSVRLSELRVALPVERGTWTFPAT